MNKHRDLFPAAGVGAIGELRDIPRCAVAQLWKIRQIELPRLHGERRRGSAIALAKDEVDGNMLDAVQSFLQDKYGIEDLPDDATDSLLAALPIWFETQFDVARG